MEGASLMGWRMSDKIDQLSASMFAVQRDLELPKTDSKGQVKGKTDYRYLSLPALIEHLQPLLEKYQLWVTQPLGGDMGSIEVSTLVFHFSGQWIELGPFSGPAPADWQQRGSAVTYARRYSLAAAFDLAADKDDDALGASGRSTGGTGQKSASPPAAAEGTAEGPSAAALADPQRWANLLSLVDGKPKIALALLNEKNGTNYATYAEAKRRATEEQLLMAVEG